MSDGSNDLGRQQAELDSPWLSEASPTAYGSDEQPDLALQVGELLRTSAHEVAERKKMGARLELFAEATRELAEATGDYQQLLDTITRRLAEVLGDLCSLRAVSEDREMLTHGAVYHADPEIVRWVEPLVRQPQRIDEGVAGTVAGTRQSIFLPRIARADWDKILPRYRPIFERLNVGSAMAVPLVSRGDLVGVLSLARSGFDNPYTEDDLRLVQSVADRAALAIGSALAHRAERAARAATEKAHEALRQSELGHRLLFEASPVPVIAFSVDTLDILAVNGAGVRLYGYTHDELLTMKLSDLRVDVGEAEVRAVVGGGGSGDLTGIAVQRRKDGSQLSVEYHSRPVSFLGHRARLAAMTDVTGRLEAERMRSLLSAIVQSSNDTIISHDLGGIITSWNGAAERLFGYTSTEMVGKSLDLLIPEELLVEEASLRATINAGNPVSNYETVRRCKSGDLVHVSVSLSPIFDTSGRVIGVSRTALDLSARLESAAALRRTEEQLRQAQKMEAVGRLAGGIAHDFNNALSVILGCSGLVLGELAANDPSRVDLEEIQAAAERAADLTRQLLTFSRQQVVLPRVLDLNRVIVDMDKILRRIVGEDIDLVSLPAVGLGRVLADPSQVDQVIMNLVVNARDAMPRGGKLTIETANVELDTEYVREHLGARPGPHVMLAVSDTGHGMDAATQVRIFEPFFTTKEKGKGTGLGLSTVFGIVQQAGGTVWVYSEPGAGAAFKVYFPRVETELEPPLRARSLANLRGTETVLLVEDQDNVRAVAHSILRRAGYDVIVARGAEDALSLSGHHRGTIHLLLTDVVMPRSSGLELAARVRSLHPGIRVLYMSGYTDDSVVRHGVLESEMAFLQKPFTPESLATKVRDVLDRV